MQYAFEKCAWNVEGKLYVIKFLPFNFNWYTGICMDFRVNFLFNLVKKRMKFSNASHVLQLKNKFRENICSLIPKKQVLLGYSGGVVFVFWIIDDVFAFLHWLQK